MRRTIKQRLTAGFVALALAISNVVLPAQTAFAMEGPSVLDENSLVSTEQAPAGDEVVTSSNEKNDKKDKPDMPGNKPENPGGPNNPNNPKPDDNEVEVTDDTPGTDQPVWCQKVGQGWISVLGDDNSGGNNPNRFPLTVLPVGAGDEIYIGEGDQVYAPDRSDPALKGLLDAACAQQVVVLDIPTPAVQCVLGYAQWVVPADTDTFDWELLGNGDLVVEIIPNGHVFTNGETSYNYGKAADSEVNCDKPVKPEYPYVKDRCGTKNDYYKIPSTRGVVYLVNGEEVEAGWYKAPVYGKVVVTAEAADGYVLTKQLYKKLHFTNKRCEADVKVHVFDKCSLTGNATVWMTLKNNTDSYQVYYYEILDGESAVVESGKKVLQSGEYFKEKMTDVEDGGYTLNVYSVNKYGKGEYDKKDLLETKQFTIECADKFTPEIYKVDHDGKVISGGVFDVEVCQQGRVSDEVLVPALVQVEVPVYEQWDCQTYEDVTFGTDGNWFKENVDGVNPHRDVKVTITETVAPEGCKAGGPWVFNWTVSRYENGTNSDVQTEQRLFGEAHRKKPVGSWDVYGGVFNLENDCRTETPEPEVPVLGVSDERPAPLQPQVLADTGDAPSAMILAALLLITGSAVLAVSPRFARMK